MDAEASPLEEIRRKLSLPLGENAVFDGWTEAAVDSAANALGVDPAQARLAVPKDQAGKIDLYYLIPADYLQTGDVTLVMPRLMRMFGLPASIAQFSIFPSGPFTATWIQLCGLIN